MGATAQLSLLICAHSSSRQALGNWLFLLLYKRRNKCYYISFFLNFLGNLRLVTPVVYSLLTELPPKQNKNP